MGAIIIFFAYPSLDLPDLYRIIDTCPGIAPDSSVDTNYLIPGVLLETWPDDCGGLFLPLYFNYISAYQPECPHDIDAYSCYSTSGVVAGGFPYPYFCVIFIWHQN